MAREKKETKEQEQKPVATRAEKKDAAKKLILEILEKGNKKASELIDEAAKLYAERLGGEDTENPNDVKGRIGSVLDVMKKEGEVLFDKGMYALKAEQAQEEKPKKTTRAKTKKAESAENAETAKTEEKPKKVTKPRVKKEQKEEKKEEEIVQPVPPAPIMPIAPVVPVTPEVAPEPMPQEEKPKKTVKSRAKKTVKAQEQPQEEPPKTEQTVAQEKTDEKKEEEKTVQEVSPKGTLMDMSFLLGETKPAPKKSVPTPAPKTESKQEKTEIKEEKQEVKQAPQLQKAERAPVQKQEVKADKRKQEKNAPKKQTRTLTADEKLQEAFLTKLHRLGGNYFEYYSVYLLERYSRKNGRRLETLKITGGDHDGGIDGEIELTDRLGFRETIYIQAKNWDPDKGDEKLWVVGETLLQQFIGACVCRQAKDGKQNCRGIFITTSRFTAEARKILDDTADKFVGYDGADLYEAAKECEFGIVKKNGVFVLDEDLLSSEKAFFRAF